MVENFYVSTSGTPDLSVSLTECQDYGASLGRSFSGANNWNVYPSGCVLAVGFNDFLYNLASTSLPCGNIDSGGSIQRNCIQKSYTESEAVETFRKVGVHATKESSSGAHSIGVYHDAATETFLCRNYKDGTRLHNSFFDRPDTNVLLAGSTFTHTHARTDTWPSQSYTHFDDDMWVGSHPSKTFFKYHADLEAYVGYLKDSRATSLTIGPRYGFLQSVSQCTYDLLRDDCIQFANVQLYNIGDMNLAGASMYYTPAIGDDICGMESNAATTDAVTEEQCTEYRNLNNYVGGTVLESGQPKGCSVYINTAGTSIPEVNYNMYDLTVSGDRAEIGKIDVNGFVSHLVCYGNPNRYNPKGCFLDTKNNLHYNGDTVFSDCSTDKQCLCSFAVPVFDVNGGLKEASNEELCSSLCSDDPSCHYLQLQDGVCYGLDTCDTTNTYEWSLQHDWTYCPTTHGSGMTVSPYYETTSGVPDGSMTYADCEQYAAEKGYSFNTHTVSGRPGGCWIYSVYPWWNYHAGSGTCQGYGNDADQRCIKKSESVFQDQLDACANECAASGFTSEYVYVKKAEATGNYAYTVYSSQTGSLSNPVKASSVRECMYLWNPINYYITFDPLTGNCWSGVGGGYDAYLSGHPNFDKQMKCHCMSDSCPAATMHANFSRSDWNQIYNRRVVTNATSTSKAYQITGKHTSFPLLPFKGFWDCDAVRFTNISTTQDCAAETKRLHHFVYSFNAEKNICVVYTHYIQDAHEQLLELGEYAEWCYKGDQLRGHDGFNLQYGTCAEDITGRDVVVHRNCDMAVKEALNGSQCLTWEVAESTYYEVSSGMPATLGVEVSSGSAAKLGTDEYMTVEECEAYAEANSLTWSGIQSESAREGIPNGCVVQRETINHVKFNPLTTSVRNCGDYWEGGSSGSPWVCIQKSPTYAAYVSQSDCQEYAESVGASFEPNSVSNNRPMGCYFTETFNKVVFNAGTSTTSCAEVSPHKWQCIQKSTNHTVPITAEFRGMVGSYHENVVEANEACIGSANCNYIYHDTHFSERGRYALYRSLHYVQGNQSFDGRFARSGSCSLSHTIYEEKSSGAPANGPMLAVTSGEPAKGPYMEVSSGEPALGPYMEVNSGSPLGDVSESECQAYAASVGKVMSDLGSNLVFPPGCSISAGGDYFFNEISTKDCGTMSHKCIQKNPEYDEARYVSEAECLAIEGGAAWDRGAGMIKGCTKDNGGNIHFNTNIANNNNVPCGNNGVCIQKQIPDPDYVSLEECEALAISSGQNHIMGWPLSWSDTQSGCIYNPSGYYFFNSHDNDLTCGVIGRPCIKKNLQRDLRYVSQEECEAYAEANGMNLETMTAAQLGNGAAWGCVKNLWATKIQWNPDQMDIAECGDLTGSGYYCIQKVPNKALEITATGYGITYKGYDPYHCTHSANVQSQLDLSSYDIFTCAQGDVEWTGFVEVSSGAPDLSVTREECQEVAGDQYQGVTGASTFPQGCTINEYGNYYWGSTAATGSCGGYSNNCIQKSQSITGTLTECEDACANDPTCRIVSYDYDTRFCRYGVGKKVSSLNLDIVEVSNGSPVAEGNPKWVSEAECEQYAGNNWGGVVNLGNSPRGCYHYGSTISFGEDNSLNINIECQDLFKCIQKYVAPSLVCSYDRDKDSFLGFVPEQACDAGFTPHSDPSLDQFQSYMLGNVQYNVGGIACEHCPLGQYPITTYGYDCENGIKQTMTCADASVDCQYGQGNVQLQQCKDYCDTLDTCQIISFVASNDIYGACYIYTATQLELPQANPSSISCAKVQISSECSPCPAGTFQRTEGQISCQNCGIGTFQDEIGQASCKACEEQTYQDQTGQTSCKVIDQFSYAGSETSKEVASNLATTVPVYRFDAIDENDCKLQVGKAGLRIMVFNSANTQCEGFYQRTERTKLAGIGLLTNLDNTNELTSGSATAYVLDEAKKVCVGSLLVGAASGPLQDNSVSDVPTAKQGGTQLCDGCANFTIAIPGTDQCEGCSAGFYYTEVNGIRCDVCDPGKYRNTEPTLGPEDDYNGSPYTDDEWDFWEWPVIDATSYRCHPCEPGKFQSSQQASSCVPCPAGKYGNTWMATECKDCPSGQFMNTVGHKALQTDAYVCSACVAGKYQNVVGQLYCKDCLAGKYMNEVGEPACKTCDAGRFLGIMGGTKAHCVGEETDANLCCEDCAAGSYSPTTASTGCTDCELGRTQSAIARKYCDNCPEGRHMGIQGSSAAECNICTAGKFSQPMWSICVDCFAGTYSAAEAGQCTFCEEGTYQSSTGQSSCTDCDAGKFLGQTGQTGTVTFTHHTHHPNGCIGAYTGNYLAQVSTPNGCYNFCDNYQDCRYFQLNNYVCYTYQGGCTQYGGYNTYKMNFLGACDDCAAGTYSNDGAASCTTCDPGYFSGSSASACTACPVGKRTVGTDRITCHDCPVGMYQDQEGQHQSPITNVGNAINILEGCKSCNGGQYSAAGSASCTNCDAGQYLEAPTTWLYSYATAASCKNCGIGEYSNAGATSCTRCPSGKYGNVAGLGACISFSRCHYGTGCDTSYEKCTGQAIDNSYCGNTDVCTYSHHPNGCHGWALENRRGWPDIFSSNPVGRAWTVGDYEWCMHWCASLSGCVYFEMKANHCYVYGGGCSGTGNYYTFQMNC